jgi:multicomponent Na+:H+ antiporter subunit D
MLTNIPPGLVMILGAALVPLLTHTPRQIFMLGLILLSGLQAWQLDPGVHLTTTIMGLDLTLIRADALTKPFALAFHIMAALGVIFGMNANCRVTESSGLAYAGAAIAALFAGDFITLFIFWELTAFTSVFLILKGNRPGSLGAAMRYLVTQVSSGVVLLAGAALLYSQGQGLTVGPLDATTLPGFLILLAFGVKAAFPFLNGWMQDAYPEASISGTVMLSAFTSKLAVFVLAQCFLGLEWLVYIGAVMIAFPVFFAVIENDLRRVLAFSSNNQIGFMVIGIGIGTELALNGVVAHAFAHIIFKSLLFMTMGAVLLRTGTTKANELGGLWRSMPLTTLFCLVGAVSISCFPLFSGYVTKTLTVASAIKEGYFWVWMVMIFASAGVLEHSGIKIPYFAFFAHDRGFKVKEAPRNMLVAMGIASLLSVIIGVYPNALYGILPYAVTFDVWEAGHLLGELQLLSFAILAFVFLMVRGLYPPEIDSTVLNTDWFFRKLAPKIIMGIVRPLWAVYSVTVNGLKLILLDLMDFAGGQINKSSIGAGAMSTSVAAGIFLTIFALLLALRFLLV